MCVALTQLFRITRKQTKACFAPSDLAALLLLSFCFGKWREGTGCRLGHTPGSWWAEIPVSLKLLPTHPHGHRLGQKHGVGWGSRGLQPSFAALPPAAWGNTPGWSRPLQGLSSSPGLLPPGDWTPSLTHYKQRANFCLAAGKGKTQTRHPHHFESLVTFESVNVNKCAVIPLRAWESRQKAGLEHAHGRYAWNPKNKRL